MLFGINSTYILSNIFSLLDTKEKLKLIKYNKSLQKKLEITLDFYKEISGRYLITEENNFSKEFTLSENILVYMGGYKNCSRNGFGVEYTNEGVIKFIGEYLNGKKNGEGKVYERYELNGCDYLIFSGNFKSGKKNGFGRKCSNDELKFEGEYLNDIKEGLGKQYYSNGKLKFEGEYKSGKKWNGKGYDLDGNVVYELKNGKGYFKKYKLNFRTLYLLFEGEFVNGQRNGKGKEYEYNKLIFEGEYLNGKRNGKGKEYYDNKNIMFNGEYKEGKQWTGKGYDPKGKEIYEINNGQGNVKFYTRAKRSYCYFEGEFKDGVENGKGISYWRGKCTPIYKTFEGIFKNGEEVEGKSFNLNTLSYEGTFLKGERWNGIEIMLEHGHPPRSKRFGGEYYHGKKWKGIEKDYRGYGDIEKEIEYKDGKIWSMKGFYAKNKNKNEKNEIAFEIKEGNGIMKEFNEDDNGEEYVSFEVEIKNGEMKGKGKRYHNKGKMFFEGEFYNYEKNGKGKEYNSNGEISFEGEYYNDHRNGKGKEYYINGNILFEGEYLFNKKFNGFFYTFDGKKESEIKNGKGQIKEYDEKGRLVFEGEYKLGERWNGNAKKYNYLGKVNFEGEYKNGKKYGNKIWYYDNGNISEINEHEGKNEKRFYEDGKLKLEGNTLDGKVKEFYQNGKIKFEGEYFFRNRKNGKEFDDKGNLIFEGQYKIGKRWEGIFKEYDDNGKLINECKYIDGEKK